MQTILHRIEPIERMNRWYMVSVEPTLFDAVAVVCRWGSRETEYQQTQVYYVENPVDAHTLATKIIRRKKKRGYEVVSQSESGA